MTPLVLDSPEILTRFDQICTLIGAQRNGISLEQLRGAHSLARELESQDPVPERIEELCAELGLDVEALS